MGEHPALSESEIEAIRVQIEKLSARQGMSLRYVNFTVNHPAF